MVFWEKESSEGLMVSQHVSLNALVTVGLGENKWTARLSWSSGAFNLILNDF